MCIALQVYIARYEQWIQVIVVQRSKTAADHSNESLLVMAYALQYTILPKLNCKLQYVHDPPT